MARSGVLGAASGARSRGRECERHLALLLPLAVPNIESGYHSFRAAERVGSVLATRLGLAKGGVTCPDTKSNHGESDGAVPPRRDEFTVGLLPGLNRPDTI